MNNPVAPNQDCLGQALEGGQRDWHSLPADLLAT